MNYLRLHIHFSRTSESGRKATLPTAESCEYISIEATTHVGRIFESNQASPVYNNRLPGFQMFENNGSTGVQKGNAVVLTRQLLSAKAQTSATTGCKATIKVASDIDLTEFGHVGTGLCDQTAARAHMGTKFDGNNLFWICIKEENTIE